MTNLNFDLLKIYLFFLEPGVHNMDCRKKDQGCSEETACYPFVDGTYRCVCPHDRSEPTEDMKCPNRKTVGKSKFNIRMNFYNL